MAKLTLNDISNLQNETSAVTNINANSTLIETALENTLSRDGASPNQMEASLDMNSFRILNLPAPLTATEPLRKLDSLPVVNWRGNWTAGVTYHAMDVVRDPLNTSLVYLALTTFVGGSSLASDLSLGYLNAITSGQDIFLTPEGFGAIANDTSVDNEAAFKAMAVVINAAHGGRVLFPPNNTYTIFKTNTTLDIIFDLSNINGLEIDFNGSKLSIAASAFSSVCYVFFFRDNNKNIRLLNLKMEHPNYSTLDPAVGSHFVFFSENLENAYIENFHQVGGRIAIGCNRLPHSTKRARNITIVNAYMEDLVYPINFQANGDNVFATGVHTKNCERSYFSYNVRNHQIWLEEEHYGNITPTCLLAVIADSAESAELNTLSDIDLYYKAVHVDNAGSNSNSAIALNFEQVDTTSAAGHMKNLNFHVDYTAGSGAQSFVVSIGDRVNHDGTSDITPRGHTLENVTVSGMIDLNGKDQIGVGLFSNFGSWAGETILPRNIVLRDLIVKGGIHAADILIDATNVGKYISLENVVCDNAITVTGGAVGVVNYSNVLSNNINSSNVTTPIVSSTKILDVTTSGLVMNNSGSSISFNSGTASITGATSPAISINSTITNTNGGIASRWLPSIISSTAASQTMYGLLNTGTLTVSANNGAAVYGNFVQLATSISSSATMGAVRTMAVGSSIFGVSPTGTVSELSTLYINTTVAGNTGTPVVTVTNTYGLKVLNQGALAGTSGYTQSTVYGIKVDDQSGGGTNYALFTGTGTVSLGDLVITSGSTTARSGLRLTSGTAPTSPVDGDMWYDGTNLKLRVGGSTKTVTLT